MRKEDIDLPEEIKNGMNHEIKFSANSNLFTERKNFDYNPLNSKKLKIGISVENKESLYGNIIITCVAVPKGYNEKDYEKAKKELHFSIKTIKPYEMETAKNLEELEIKYIIELINEIPEFWKHEIRIYGVYNANFYDIVSRLMPANLKKNELINPEDWTLETKCVKECALASIFAREILNEEIEYINSLYGDIGKGEPTDTKVLNFIKESLDNLPPFVRKSLSPVKEWIK